jgi:hypothetical protein
VKKRKRKGEEESRTQQPACLPFPLSLWAGSFPPTQAHHPFEAQLPPPSHAGPLSFPPSGSSPLLPLHAAQPEHSLFFSFSANRGPLVSFFSFPFRNGRAARLRDLRAARAWARMPRVPPPHKWDPRPLRSHHPCSAASNPSTPPVQSPCAAAFLRLCSAVIRQRHHVFGRFPPR